MVALSCQRLVTAWAPGVSPQDIASQAKEGGDRKLRRGQVETRCSGGWGGKPGSSVRRGGGSQASTVVAISLAAETLDLGGFQSRRQLCLGESSVCGNGAEVSLVCGSD